MPEKQQKVASPTKPPTETAPPGPPGPLPSGICQLHAVAKQFCEMGDLHAYVDIATVTLHDAMKNELASLDADGGAWVAENFGGMTAVSTEEYKNPDDKQPDIPVPRSLRVHWLCPALTR